MPLEQKNVRMPYPLQAILIGNEVFDILFLWGRPMAARFGDRYYRTGDDLGKDEAIIDYWLGDNDQTDAEVEPQSWFDNLLETYTGPGIT